MTKTDVQQIVLLLMLTGLLLIAPLYLETFTLASLGLLILLELVRWRHPEHSYFSHYLTENLFQPEPVKKKVKIVEAANLYIEDEQSAVTRSSQDAKGSHAKIPEMHERLQPDVTVSAAGLRIAGATCGFSVSPEYKLEVLTPDGLHWRVWKTYEQIYRLHNIVERVLESDASSHSLITRVVPRIPPPKVRFPVRFMPNRRNMASRRRAGVEQFVTRVFGEKSNYHHRQLALKIPQVREFFDLAVITKEVETPLLKSEPRSLWGKHWSAKKRMHSTAEYSYGSTESEEL